MFFPVRLVMDWSKWFDVTSIACLDGALSNLNKQNVSLAMAEGWN